MSFILEGAAVLTLTGVGLPVNVGSTGMVGDSGAQDVELAYGNPAQMFLGMAPGVASETFTFSGSLLTASMVAVVNALISTSSTTAGLGYVGSGVGRKLTACYCESFTVTATLGSPTVTISGTMRSFIAAVAEAAPTALTPTVNGLVDGVTLLPATLIGGSHAVIGQQSFGMQRSFNTYGRDPATGFPLLFGVRNTHFTADVTYAEDGVDEEASWTPACPSVGTIIESFGSTCGGASVIVVTLTSMLYKTQPRQGGAQVITKQVSAVSGLGIATCVAA